MANDEWQEDDIKVSYLLESLIRMKWTFSQLKTYRKSTTPKKCLTAVNLTAYATKIERDQSKKYKKWNEIYSKNVLAYIQPSQKLNAYFFMYTVF